MPNRRGQLRYHNIGPTNCHAKYKPATATNPYPIRACVLVSGRLIASFDAVTANGNPTTITPVPSVRNGCPQQKNVDNTAPTQGNNPKIAANFAKAIFTPFDATNGSPSR